MNRRELLAAAAALAFAAPGARAGGKPQPHVDYSPEAYERAVASGKPLLLDFYTEW